MHFEGLESIENYLGNDQAAVLFVVSWNDIPWRIFRARCTETRFISQHILFPEFPLFNVGKTEFPVFIRLIDTIDKTLRCSSQERCRKNLRIRVPLR